MKKKKKKTLRSYAMLVTLYQSKRVKISKDLTLEHHHCENLLFRLLYAIFHRFQALPAKIF